ncbi:MAG: hypothetical protein EBZ93_11280 [Actinobacteria bacterium]|nr:hypothetical protein [Actinomycetota bacterium]
MDKDYLNDLITRLRNSSTPPELREEVIRVITRQRFFLEDIHISAKQNHDRSGEHLSGLALGKPGYSTGDVSI